MIPCFTPRLEKLEDPQQSLLSLIWALNCIDTLLRAPLTSLKADGGGWDPVHSHNILLRPLGDGGFRVDSRSEIKSGSNSNGIASVFIFLVL